MDSESNQLFSMIKMVKQKLKSNQVETMKIHQLYRTKQTTKHIFRIPIEINYQNWKMSKVKV